MNIVIILAHPRPGSFNHSIAEMLVESLRDNGQKVIFHDLYREKFNPVLHVSEMDGNVVEPIIDRHCREIADADGIIVIHPVWWEQPPAILKGWVDRVFRPDVAYDFSTGKTVGLLKARFALVFNTSSTHEETRRVVFGDPLQSIWGKSVFTFCGVKHFDYRIFHEIQNSTMGQREIWMQEIKDLTFSMVAPVESEQPSARTAESWL